MSFWDHDYSFPIFDTQFKPVLPKLDRSDKTVRHVNEAKRLLKELARFLQTKIIKKRCRLNLLLCYSEQLEYILAYNYNGVKFHAPNGKHKVPFMFFPAHGKHLCIPDSVIDEHGVNVLMKNPGFSYSKCNCDKMVESRPTIIYCNPNALNYEQMVNYPHNFWLKYFMNLGCNVVIWNYRGYGCAKGTPSPKTLQEDGQALYEYVRKTLHITGKIGVYGRSLGGIVATHIAA